MIIVRLMGGLGNQMFQWAHGLALARLCNRPLSVDESFLLEKNRPKTFVYRNYELDLFEIGEKNSVDIKQLENKVVVSERHFHYDAELAKRVSNIVLKSDLDVVLIGYWQSPRYFTEILDVKKIFKPKDSIDSSDDSRLISLYERIVNSEAIMVNVRRGDFVNSTFHGTMSTQYFYRSVAEIRSKRGMLPVFVFSDDTSWCIDNLPIPNSVVVGHEFAGSRFTFYFQLMSACTHFVIPNSTFAWWAAYLGQTENSIVYRPRHWFLDGSIDTKDLFPNSWLQGDQCYD